MNPYHIRARLAGLPAGVKNDFLLGVTDFWQKKNAQNGVSSSGAKLYINATRDVATRALYRVCALMEEDDFEIPEDEEVALGKICEGTLGGRGRSAGGWRRAGAPRASGG